MLGIPDKRLILHHKHSNQTDMRYCLFFLLFISFLVARSQKTEQEIIETIDSYYQSGNLKGGIHFLESYLEKFYPEGTVPDSNYTFFLNELAIMYYYIENYIKAESIIIKICETDSMLYGTSNLDYSTDLSNLGELYRSTGNFNKALAKFLEAMSINKRIQILDSTNYYFPINNLGALYHDMGMLSEAVYYTQLVANYSTRAFSENDPHLAVSYNNLAILLELQGNFPKAIELLSKSIEINKNYYGKNHDFYASDLNNLATLYLVLGNYEQAEKIALQALAIYENNTNELKLNKAYTLSNLAKVYIHKGKLDTAKEIEKVILKTLSSKVSEVHSLYLSTLSQMASIEITCGNLTKAKQILRKQIDIETRVNNDHTSLHTAYYNISIVFAQEVNFDSSISYLEKARKNMMINRLTFHPNYIKCESAIASILSYQGKSIESKLIFEKSLRQLQDIIPDYFSFMTENQRSEFFEALTINYYRFLSFLIQNTQSFPDLPDQAFDMQALTTGMLLNSTMHLKRDLANDSNLSELYQTWVDTKENFSNSLYSGLGTNFSTSDSIIGLMDSLEKALNQQSDAFTKFIKDRKVSNWRQIQSALTRNEAFVMLIRFPFYDFVKNDSIVYLALVLTTETKDHPLLIRIPEGNRLDNEFYNSYLENIKLGCNIDYEYHDIDSYIHFWKPLEEILAKKRKIYILPDGVYHIVNIGALQISPNEYLGDHQEFYILNSVQDFKPERTKRQRNSSRAALFGDPAYDLLHQIESTDSVSKTRNYGIKIKRLPGTLKEVMALDSLLRNTGWITDLFLSGQATEHQLKKLVEPNMLVLSTHGFFRGVSIDSDQGTSTIRNSVATPEINNSLIQSLLNSGLLLAGAQNSLENADLSPLGTDDGILTSFEISNLTFNDLDLVVLSSCESGLGTINSEGIYGLQRGFRIAGAHNVLISLWEIDDNATQLFIRKFMEYYLNGINAHEALKKTQFYFRTETAYKHPYYWGSFICVGSDLVKSRAISTMNWTLLIFSSITIIFIAFELFYKTKNLKNSRNSLLSFLNPFTFSQKL